MQGSHPLGIGRLLGTYPSGKLKFQWVGNRSYNIRSAALQPGWLDRDDRSYFDPKKRRQQDRIYMGEHDQTDIEYEDIIVHSFSLTPNHKLPSAIRRILYAPAPGQCDA